MGPALLAQHAPVLRYDSAERDRATAVEALVDLPLPRGADAIALRPRRRPLPDVTYGRAVRGSDGRTWLQYWFLYATNTQDRGIFRTGRHEGDWELVQVGLPDRITYAQHSWAEACAFDGGRPAVFVANASHASYRTAGTHDRPWPDPDDEADGRGRRVVPEVRPFGPWVDWPGRWGRSEDSWIPGEQPSPPGPKFQESRAFQDPAGFHAGARECGSGPPGHPWPVWAALFIGLALAAFTAHRTYVRLHE